MATWVEESMAQVGEKVPKYLSPMKKWLLKRSALLKIIYLCYKWHVITSKINTIHGIICFYRGHLNSRYQMTVRETLVKEEEEVPPPAGHRQRPSDRLCLAQPSCSDRPLSSKPLRASPSDSQHSNHPHPHSVRKYSTTCVYTVLNLILRMEKIIISI